MRRQPTSSATTQEGLESARFTRNQITFTGSATSGSTRPGGDVDSPLLNMYPANTCQTNAVTCSTAASVSSFSRRSRRSARFTDIASPDGSSRLAAITWRSIKGRCIQGCSSWSRRAGFGPRGENPTAGARSRSTRSPGPVGNASPRKRPPGSTRPASSRGSSRFRTSIVTAVRIHLARLLGLVGRDTRRERELRAEIDAHIAEAMDEYIREGVTPRGGASLGAASVRRRHPNHRSPPRSAPLHVLLHAAPGPPVRRANADPCARLRDRRHPDAGDWDSREYDDLQRSQGPALHAIAG